MKRSQMKSKIHKAIESCYAIQPIIPDHVLEAILVACEESGMLPPKAQIKKQSYMYDDEGELMFDEEISVPAHEWEDEF